MKRFQIFALVLVAGLVGIGGVAGQTPSPAQPGAPATSDPAGNTEDGRKLYVSYGCYQCHGREGQGSTATGPRLAGRLLPLAGFSRYVRNPPGEMPPYRTAVLSESDLEHMYEFLRTRPEPPPVESLPQLR
jgi:mono/diheme cytochrome c family protein